VFITVALVPACQAAAQPALLLSVGPGERVASSAPASQPTASRDYLSPQGPSVEPARSPQLASRNGCASGGTKIWIVLQI